MALGDFLGDPVTNKGVRWEKKIDEATQAEYVIAHTNGAYIKGFTSGLGKLKAALRTTLPEDFIQFYSEFGEALVITRSDPLWLWNEERMIQGFEEDFDREFDDEFPEGRFFTFANYPSEPTLRYGLRKNDLTDAWEVVRPNHGAFYEEIIGPEGREHYVAETFYDWLKSHVERDGYPDFYPPEEHHLYSVSLD
jgi:hypothetical protein